MNFLTRESRAIARSADRKDRDNSKAILAYLIGRGAFAECPVAVSEDTRIVGSVWAMGPCMSYASTTVVIEYQCRGEEPWKLRRPAAVTVYAAEDHYTKDRKGRSKYLGRRMAPQITVPIPHWDA